MIERKEKLFTDEVKRLIPILGRHNVERLSRAYLLGDEDTRDRIFELIDVSKAAVFTENELRDSILMEPPERDAIGRGELNLGSVLYGRKRMYPMRFEKKRLLMHMGIFGSSGYGKTNLAHRLIGELAKEDVPVLVFDFSKRNYRRLLKTRLKDRIDLYTVGRNASPLKFNPLVPPEGIQISQWMKEFSSVFDHAYMLLGGGRHIILKAFDSVFEDNEKPRLRDIKAWINEYSDLKLPVRERNWVATAARPLDSLCFREIGDIFNCDAGVVPSDFLREGRITILELDALDTNDKTFFIEIILQWIRDWLLISRQRETLKGVIILEEAHHVLNREKALRTVSETVMDFIFREIRELGLGIVYIDQHPSLVSYPALGNTSTHIYMNLGLDTKQSSDILDATHMLGLDYEEEGSYLRRLPVGHGFMLCRNFDFPRPFLVKFDEVRYGTETVTDEEVVRKRSEMISSSLESRPKKEVLKPAGEAISEIRSEIRHDRAEPEPEEAAAAVIAVAAKWTAEDLDDQGWKILKIVGSGYGTFASQIYKTLRMSGSAFNEKVSTLLDAGLVSFARGKTGKNRLHFYFLTDKGEEAFRSNFERFEGDVDADFSGLVEMFSIVGWKCTRKEDILEVTKDDDMIRMALVYYTDKNRMNEALKASKHFICANGVLKNMLIQQAARRSLKRPGMMLFVSTAEEFEDSCRFEKIEFEAK